jgi:hypothetical protein
MYHCFKAHVVKKYSCSNLKHSQKQSIYMKLMSGTGH